jgi:hypothetical protein
MRGVMGWVNVVGVIARAVILACLKSSTGGGGTRDREEDAVAD